jgi:hypothetical protein
MEQELKMMNVIQEFAAKLRCADPLKIKEGLDLN